MGERLDGTKQIVHGMREDFRSLREDHGFLGAAGLVALGAAVVPYHAGGLESTLGFTAAHVYEATHNPVVTGIAVGGASGAIEATLAFVVAAGLSRFPHTTSALTEVKYHSQEPKPTAEGRLAGVSNVLNAMSYAALLGSPGIELRSYAKSPEAEKSVHLRSGLRAAGGLAVANTVLGTAVIGGIWLNEEAGASAVSEKVIDYAQNPLTYLAIIGGLVAINQGRKLIGRLRRPKDSPRQDSTES